MTEYPRGSQQPPPVPVLDQTEKDARLWSMLCHLSALAGCLGIPLGNIVGPLVVWLVKRNEIPVVDEHGKEAVNFQISVTIYCLVSAPFVLILVGIPLLVGLIIFDLVMVVVASVNASNGQRVRYPLCIRFIK